MIETIGSVLIAVGAALAVMIVVATILRGIIGLPKWVVWIAQTAVLYQITTYSFLAFTGIQVPILIAAPTVIHGLRFITKKRRVYKAKTGQYGEETRWAYELFEENDFEFIHAATSLPPMDKREVEVIADTKQEFRDLMIERYDELADDSLEDTDFFKQMNQNN